MDVGEYNKMYELEDVHFWFVGKRMFVDSFLGKYFQKSNYNILDVGCGTGGMTKWLEKYGNVVGQEKNSQAVKFSKKRGLKVIQGDAKNIKFKDESFDLVTIFDVLYHKKIRSDDEVLKEVLRVLKPGGLLMITDSAMPWLYGDHDIVMQARERYSLKDLSRKVGAGGFKIIKKSYLFFFLFPLVVVKRLIKFKKKDSDVSKVGGLVNTILILIMKFESFGLSYFSYPLGSSVGILAKKKEV